MFNNGEKFPEKASRWKQETKVMVREISLKVKKQGKELTTRCSDIKHEKTMPPAEFPESC
jgi:hypothetical protein